MAKAADLLKRKPGQGVKQRMAGYSVVGSRNHLAPDLQKMGIGIRRLEQLRDYRLEMQLVYKALTAGFLTEKGASRLIWILDMLARRKIDEEKLSLVRSGQLGGGQPFSGLTIIGPTAAIQAEDAPLISD